VTLSRAGHQPEHGGRTADASGELARASVGAARRLRPAAGNPALERVAGLAARLLATPASQLSLLTDVQTVAAGVGLPAGAVGADSPLADSLCTVTATSGSPLVITDATGDERVAGLTPVTSGAVGSYLGVPLVDDDGRTVGALCVFDPVPRQWSPSDVTLLEQLAASAVAELELSALTAEHETGRLLWELAIDAAGIGTFDWNLATGTLHWDDQLLALFGYDRDDFPATIQGFDDRVHPDDLPRVKAALEHAIANGGPFSAEYRVLLPDGRLRWVEARGRSLTDPSGRTVRVLGAAQDASERHEQEARVSQVLEAMSAAFYSLDSDWRFTYVNAEAERLLGRPRDELLGGVLWELFPATVGSEFEVQYRHARSTGRATVFEAYYPAPLDGWYELRAWPSADGLGVYFLDISARRAAQERAALLTKATATLTDTLDLQEAVARLARMVVPALGDWCIVTLVDGDADPRDWRRALRDVGWWHDDPALRPVLEQYARERIASFHDDAVLAQALRTGEQVVVRSATDVVAATLPDGPPRELLRALAPRSAVVQPMRGRDRTLGVLTLCLRELDEPRRADLDTIAELAGRAGLALDNARLYEQQRQLAEGLQRSLLTEPPQPDHAHVVVRYQAAARAAQVGGDWYDAFLQPPGGAMMLVIGDVIGHDTVAAAAMGQVRGLLRGIAANTGDGPADVLRQVDQVMRTLRIDTTATALVARLEQTPEERTLGITRLRWSNAGHPPPLVLRPDGTVSALPDVEPDLLLGIDPSTPRTESEVVLDRGDTVLLHTDGLVERRGQSLDDGLAQLRAVLAGLATEPLTLDELCDRVLQRMLPATPEDDVALVAVRLHPQDAARPAEAGPRRLPDDVPDEPQP
jgi:PAS domain S-box-containing protein